MNENTVCCKCKMKFKVLKNSLNICLPERWTDQSGSTARSSISSNLIRVHLLFCNVVALLGIFKRHRLQSSSYGFGRFRSDDFISFGNGCSGGSKEHLERKWIPPGRTSCSKKNINRCIDKHREKLSYVICKKQHFHAC